MARLEWNLDEAKAAWREEAMEEGMEEGMKKGILSSIRNLMESMKWTVDQAMDALKISYDDREKYKAAFGL